MLTILFIACIAVFAAAYFIYGRFLERKYDVSNSNATPSHTDYDGIDRVPAHPAVLLGHQFSSIAGAGPIVGPIIAAMAFGWLPPLLWVIFGSIFIGGVHDYSSLIASIRHRGRSIAEIAKEHISPLSYKLFLSFIWLTLVYVIIVFVDLTTTTFVNDPGVASSSMIFMALAVGFGISVYRMKIPVWISTLIFVPLVFLASWYGQVIPLSLNTLQSVTGLGAAQWWKIILVAYCFIASVTPVWILLQPRDYLSSYLLYASVFGGFFGILLGGFSFSYPAYIGYQSNSVGDLIPFLFITVACGAISGFHAVVASGTSSKQIDKETDAKPIGYGAMLIEGAVAVIALVTIIIVSKETIPAGADPISLYGEGIGKFLNVFGVPHQHGKTLGLLALSTFILTTLDTATRLGRYIFEEFFSMQNLKARYLSTLATVALPLVFAFMTYHDSKGNAIPAWKAIWPVFGASNQLLAAMTFIVLTVWLKKMKKGTMFLIIPMIFMCVITLWALGALILKDPASGVGVIAILLFVLAILLIAQSWKILTAKSY
jgi:carbon starvation protein